MQIFKLSAIAALALQLSLQVYGAESTPNSTFTGKLDANQSLATAAGTRVTGVTGWTVRRDGDLTLFEAPENNARVGIIDTKATDAKAAIEAAWARMGGPNARRVPITMSAAAARTGWDERIIAGYDIPNDDQMYAQAVALRRGSSWSVIIVDSALSTIGKRSAALSQMLSSMAPADYKPENFSGSKAHALDAARIAQMRDFLSQSMKDLGIPGIGYALLDSGKIVFEGGLGVRELGKPALVDANTLFMAASNTKGMTTLLLATLADQGKLRWEQPVTQLYPPFALGNADTTSKVLVKHLVCACTGLPRRDMEWLFEYSNVSALDSMAMLAKNSPTSGFGELYQYNNLMAGGAGFVAAHVAYPNMELGKAYDKAMQERIFNPLGMKTTTFNSRVALRGNHAGPHATGLDNVVTTVPFELNNAVYPHRPAGGVWTSAHEFARYVQLEASEGKLPNGKQLVSAENLLMRRKPQVSSGLDKTYGMGLSNERMAGVDVVLHGGSLFGYKSNFYLVPATGTGIVLLTNSDEGQLLLKPTLRRLIELMYDAKPEAAEDVTVAARLREVDRAALAKQLTLPPDPAVTGNLAKHYRNTELGDLWIRRKGKHMVLDAGEWQVAFGSRKDDAGKLSLVTVAPEFKDLAFSVGAREGKRTLMLHNIQHEYEFIEAK